MCQLLGMNANTPTDVMFSFAGLATRADEHKDGFGIAFFEGRGLRLFIDPESARTSPVAQMVKAYPIRSRNVIAHVRKATVGDCGAGELPPLRARALGPLLGVRPQRRPEEPRPAAARPVPPGGRHRQRTCLLLADAGAGQGACRRADGARADAHPARAAAARRRLRQLQPAAQQRAGAVGACVDKTALAGAPAPLRRRRARRRGPERGLRRPDDAGRPGGGDRHRTADQRRNLDRDGAG
jgi:hypothetical protein